MYRNKCSLFSPVRGGAFQFKFVVVVALVGGWRGGRGERSYFLLLFTIFFFHLLLFCTDLIWLLCVVVPLPKKPNLQPTLPPATRLHCPSLPHFLKKQEGYNDFLTTTTTCLHDSYSLLVRHVFGHFLSSLNFP